MIDNYISWSTRFIPYYNEIAKTINSMTHNQIGYKNSCYQTVTQNDLNTLRDAIRELYSYALDIGKFRANGDKPGAITDTENYLKINEGKGFLVFPADQTPNHMDIFENYETANFPSRGLSFSGIPVQEYQFVDMANVVNAITHLILGNAPQSAFQVTASWSNCITKSMILSGELVERSVDNLSNGQYVGSYTEQMGQNPARFNYNAQQGVYRLQLSEYSLASRYIGERHLFCLHQEYWNYDTIGDADNPTIVYDWQEKSNDVTYSGSADGVDTSVGFGKCRRHYRQIDRIVPILCPSVKAVIKPLYELDSEDDGLVGCGCQRKKFNAVEVLSEHETRYDLGTTNGGRYGCNLYHTVLKDKYLNMHSFSIRKVAHGSITSQTFSEGGTTYRMGYSILKRPNGVEMPIYWRFDGTVATLGRPVNQFDYTLRRLADARVQAIFPNQACQEFNSSGSLTKAYKITCEGWIPASLSYNSPIESSVSSYNRTTLNVPQGKAVMDWINGIPPMMPRTEDLLARVIQVKYYNQSNEEIGYTNRAPETQLAVTKPDTANANACISGHAFNETLTMVKWYPSEPGAAPTEHEVMRVATEVGSIPKKTWWINDNGTMTVYLTETSVWTWVSNTVGKMTITRTRKNCAPRVETITYQQISRRWLPIRIAIGEGATARVTQIGYTSTGLEQYRLEPDGSWVYYTYDDFRRVTSVITPFGNTALEFTAGGAVIPPTGSGLRIKEYSYTGNFANEQILLGDYRIRCVVEKKNGKETGRRYHSYYSDSCQELTAKTPGAAAVAAENIVSTSYSYPSGTYAGRHWKRLNADGTMEFTSYAASGGNEIETVTQGAPNAAKDAIIDGTKSVTTYNAAGEAIRVETYDIATNVQLEVVEYERDGMGNATKTTYADGSEDSGAYACCGAAWTESRDGSVQYNSYTPDQLLWKSLSAGVLTTYSHDSSGNVIRTEITADGNLSQVTESVYADNGMLTATKVLLDSGEAVTTYAEERSGDYWRKTTTNPDGGTLIEEINRDGSVARTSGTAAGMIRCSDAGVTATGELYQREYIYDPTGSTESDKIREAVYSYLNFLGEVYQVEQRVGTAVNLVSETYFDALGRVIRQVSGGVTQITEYNAKGEAWRSGISLSGGTTLTASDPVTETTTSAETAENKNWHVSTMKTYNDANAAVVLRTTKTSADGRTTKQIEFGRTTTTTRTYYNSVDEKGMSVTTTAPDGTTVTESYNADGLLESSTHSVLGDTTYTYDGLNRVATQSHFENGVEHVTSYTYDKRSQVKSVTESCGNAVRSTSYEYDSMGRKTKEIKPGNRVVTYTYDLTGAMVATSGAETYPQSYTYAFGRMKTLTTYRNNLALPEITTWNYDVFGRLSSKKYANNSQVSYSYNANNQLSTRSWARGRTTSYTYDGAGRLKTVTYDGSDTPKITYAYNRLGQLTQVVDAAGTRTLTYNPDGTPATETVPNVTGHTVSHTYDTLGRETALKLMNGATALYETGYTYDNMSRLATTTFANQSATYSRVSGSNRLNTTIFKNGTTAIHTATRSYDNFNRLLGVNGYNYTYNDKDERTKQALADGNYWNYGYDALGQVTSGAKKTSAGAQVTGQNYAYTYDTIGNRITATANSAVTNYTANDVNQYTAIGNTTPTYDTDGNMLTGYNGWTMEWNGENRLKTIYTATTKLEFQYDYMGRRFSKKVYTKSGSSWVLSNEKAFAYNGYKQIAEYTVSGTTKTLSKSTVWQPAASGDLDVVLWYRDGSTVYTLLPDGNKNTRQLKTTAGTVVATYDYDPFGNVIATTGTVVNPWKFSNEYHDSETGLVYYNYRDYAPSLGRWISRDQIGEYGGNNLYMLVRNNIIYSWDQLGLRWQIYRTKDMAWGAAHDNKIKRIKTLGEKILLDHREAFGPNGWVKTIELADVLDDKQFKNEDCLAVPNTIAIITGYKKLYEDDDNFTAVVEKLRKSLEKNSFKVVYNLKEKGILGVIYLGHFTPKGLFAISKENNVDHNSIFPNAISYRIAAFIGLGCISGNHDWYKATAWGWSDDKSKVVWTTDYNVDLTKLAEVPLTQVYPKGGTSPGDGDYIPPDNQLGQHTGSTGKSGISIQNFIEGLANHISS